MEVKGRTLASKLTNRWNLRLNDDVPLDLRVEFGAGEGKLNLAGLSLRSVDVDMGVGQLVLDLTGDWEKNFDVRVRGGVGEVEVRLPRQVGVIVEARGGIGEINARGLNKQNGRYVNDAYGESPITIQLDVKGGIGEIKLIG